MLLQDGIYFYFKLASCTFCWLPFSWLLVFFLYPNVCPPFFALVTILLSWAVPDEMLQCNGKTRFYFQVMRYRLSLSLSHQYIIPNNPYSQLFFFKFGPFSATYADFSTCPTTSIIGRAPIGHRISVKQILLKNNSFI